MANIKSIGGNPIVLDASGIAAGAVTPDKLPDIGGITAGAANGITGEATDSAAWLQRVSTSDGPTTIRGIHGNTIVQDGVLVPVNMTGIESTGFNQWDEEWESGQYNTTTGEKADNANRIRSKNYIDAFPSTAYHMVLPATGGNNAYIMFYDAGKTYIDKQYVQYPTTGTDFTTPANCRYMTFFVWGSSAVTTYNNDICINISDPARNGTYEPYWQQMRSIPATDLRSVDSVYDELRENERIMRVGVVDLGTLTWHYQSSWSSWYSDYADFDAVAAASGAASNVLHASLQSVPASEITSANYQTIGIAIGKSDSTTRVYVRNGSSTSEPSGNMQYQMTTPTTTPIGPPLNMTYRTAAGGTERVMVPTGENSALPTIVAAQGYTAESLRDAALSAIAPVENGLASTNYGVGSYLVHSGQLCKVTTAIATGEAITIGTNVTATTVMAEVIALIAQ